VIAATPAHAEALAAIHRSAFPRHEAWGEEAFARQLRMPGTYGLIDERGGLVVARVAADQSEILTLGVKPRLRRQGVGAALLGAAIREAKARGAHFMFLEVAINNAAARALYANVGFEATGVRRLYYADGADALVLRARFSTAGSTPR
jgi:[ribosomal protein S18]-alanine N-acetyltransferase